MTAARDPATLLKAMESCLELAALCDQKAATLRDMAEALALEAGRPVDGWTRQARQIAADLERRAAARPASANWPCYRTDSGLAQVAWLNGRAEWRLNAKPIARALAVNLIAERMASRLG